MFHFHNWFNLVPLNLIRIGKHFRRSQTRGTRGKLLTRRRSKEKIPKPERQCVEY